jgi:hypothetical protein
MRRRELLVGSLTGAELIALARLARANSERPKELLYQKSGMLVIARQQQCVLEKHLGGGSGSPAASGYETPDRRVMDDRHGRERAACAS